MEQAMWKAGCVWTNEGPLLRVIQARERQVTRGLGFHSAAKTINPQNTAWSKEKILDDIHLTWFDGVWHEQHAKLVEFKKINGHCAVPAEHEQDLSLGNWVRKQQQNHGIDCILPDKKDLLDELGFVWSLEALESKGNKQHEKLVKCRRKKGNCLVPFKCEKDRSLGVWVFTQQRKHEIPKKCNPIKRNFWTSSTLSGKLDPAKLALLQQQIEDVRGLAIGSFCTLGCTSCFSLSLFLCLTCAGFAFGSVH
jgi:hypothetical protein